MLDEYEISVGDKQQRQDYPHAEIKDMLRRFLYTAGLPPSTPRNTWVYAVDTLVKCRGDSKWIEFEPPQAGRPQCKVTLRTPSRGNKGRFTLFVYLQGMPMNNLDFKAIPAAVDLFNALYDNPTNKRRIMEQLSATALRPGILPASVRESIMEAIGTDVSDDGLLRGLTAQGELNTLDDRTYVSTRVNKSALAMAFDGLSDPQKGELACLLHASRELHFEPGQIIRLPPSFPLTGETLEDLGAGLSELVYTADNGRPGVTGKPIWCLNTRLLEPLADLLGAPYAAPAMPTPPVPEPEKKPIAVARPPAQSNGPAKIGAQAGPDLDALKASLVEARMQLHGQTNVCEAARRAVKLHEDTLAALRKQFGDLEEGERAQQRQLEAIKQAIEDGRGKMASCRREISRCESAVNAAQTRLKTAAEALSQAQAECAAREQVLKVQEEIRQGKAEVKRRLMELADKTGCSYEQLLTELGQAST